MPDHDAFAMKYDHHPEDANQDIYNFALNGALDELRRLNDEALKTAEEGPYAGPHLVAGLLDRIERMREHHEQFHLACPSIGPEALRERR